ncbi:MAG: hypothetical protein K8S98_15170 [Planctomycetes bacterium]|nr:hypothetical protein [Planctomycetota bacterium]
MKDAERLLPLLRAIRRELRDRTYEATRLEDLRDALRPTQQAHAADLNLLESDLSTQLRELRRTEKELTDLGCRLDQDRPLRIVVPSDQGDLAVDGDLAKTTLRRLPVTQRV